MVLDERNGGLQRLDGFRLVLDDHLLVLLSLRNILTHYCVRTQPECQTYDEANRHLTYNLIDALQTFLVLTEYLDIVIHEPQEPQPYRCDNHEQQIDVSHSSQQDYRHQNAHNDDDATHGGDTLLLFSKGVDARITRCL